MNKEKLVAFLFLGFGVAATMMGVLNLFHESITVKGVSMHGGAKQGFLLVASFFMSGEVFIILWNLFFKIERSSKIYILKYYFIPFLFLWLFSLFSMFIKHYYIANMKLICAFSILMTFVTLYRLVSVILDNTENKS
jgi:hypothetical protein